MPEPAPGVPGRPCRITSSCLQRGQGPGLVWKLRKSLGGRAVCWEGGALGWLLLRTAASRPSHQRRAGAPDAADMGLLRAQPSPEGVCAPDRLFQFEMRSDSRNRAPGPQSWWEPPVLLQVFSLLSGLRVSQTRVAGLRRRYACVSFDTS